MERILVATDGSPGSRAAVDDGLELARKTGATVTFVYVRHPIALLGRPRYQRKLSEQLAHGRAVLDQAMAAAEEVEVEADSDITEGDVVDEILRAAVYRDADLIVVGSRGLGALAGAVLGSVSRALIELSPLPVLVCKEREAAATEPAERERSAV